MRYYARVVFCVDNDYSFSNLSQKPVQLFADGAAVCMAYTDNRFLRPRIVMEYGAFQTKEEAEDKGTNLVRRIKLEMLKREYPINISESAGALDSPFIHSVFGGVSEWAKVCETQDIRAYKKILENEHIGLGVYEVSDTMEEIQFIGGECSMQLSQRLSMSNEMLAYWDDYMDISLSLLGSSVAVNDMRVTFLLRLMAVEALVSKPQHREGEYLCAIEQLKGKIDETAICGEYKERLKGQLGMFKEKSISQKVNELLKIHLSGKQYAGQSADKLFARCYRARSSFVHTGKLHGISGDIVRELKMLCMDLLYSLSAGNSTQQ